MTSEAVSRPRRRRWLLLALLLVMVALRLALPGVLRLQLATALSEQLGRAVSIGSLRLGLLAGTIGVNDIAIHPVDGHAPELSIRRLDAAVDRLRLLDRTVHLTEVTLVDPTLSTERSAGGDFVVPALLDPAAEVEAPGDDAPVPSPPAVPEEPEESTEPATSSWAVVIDRLVLTNAQLSFFDRSVKADALAMRMPHLEASGITLGRTGTPIVVDLRGALDDGEVTVHATIAGESVGATLTVETKATGLPLERLTPYVADLGWRALEGTLDGHARYVSAPAGARTLDGAVTLRDLAVRVPDLDRPAVRATTATVTVEAVDFVRKAVRITSITASGPRVLVRPDAPRILPLLPAEDDTPADGDDEWTWSIGKVTVTNGVTDLERGDDSVPIAVDGTVGTLPGGDDGFPVTLTATNGSVSVDATGRITTDPFGLEADLETSDSPLGEILTLAGVTPPVAVKSGTVSATIALALGAAAGPDTTLSLGGTMTLHDTFVTGADDAFSARAATLRAELEGVRRPADGSATTVRLSRLAIASPSVKLTRNADGWLLPSSDAPSKDDPAPATEVVAAELVVDDGRIEVIDRTLRPAFNEDFRDLSVRAKRVRWPGLRIGELATALRTPTRGTVEVSGWVRRNETKLDIRTLDVAIPPYNGYLSEIAGYRAGTRSRATVTSRLRIDPKRYRAENHLVLGDLSLKGKRGEERFRKQVGIPLPVALSLLRNANGNVVLDVPIEGGRNGTRVALAPVVGSAIRQAMISALASPLKIIGSVVPKDGERFDAELPSVPFRTGVAELHPDADSSVATLGVLLSTAPGLRVRLQPIVGERDRRGLARAELLRALQAPSPPDLVVDIDAEQRERLRVFLTQRRTGAEPTLDDTDRETLDALLDAIPANAEARHALARARLQRLHEVLTSDHGVAEAQLVDGDANRPGAGAPAIEVELLAAE